MPTPRSDYYGPLPSRSPPTQIEPVTGARAIGALLQLTQRQVYRLVEAKKAGRDEDPIPRQRRAGSRALR
jgi:hypothetical protein